jgi:hypothetical protein
MDPRLVGVWIRQEDPRERWTFRPDGTLQWWYRGEPDLDLPDSALERTYRADAAHDPAHLDLRGVFSPALDTYHVYDVTDDTLRVAGRWSVATSSGCRPTEIGTDVIAFTRGRGAEAAAGDAEPGAAPDPARDIVSGSS